MLESVSVSVRCRTQFMVFIQREMTSNVPTNAGKHVGSNNACALRKLYTKTMIKSSDWPK